MVLSPVKSLEIVGSHDIDVLLPGYTGKKDDFLCVSRFQQCFQCLHTHTHTHTHIYIMVMAIRSVTML